MENKSEKIEVLVERESYDLISTRLVDKIAGLKY